MFRLVYNKDNQILETFEFIKAKTLSPHNIEDFETEELMQGRIEELGLIPIVEEIVEPEENKTVEEKINEMQSKIEGLSTSLSETKTDITEISGKIGLDPIIKVDPLELK